MSEDHYNVSAVVDGHICGGVPLVETMDVKWSCDHTSGVFDELLSMQIAAMALEKNSVEGVSTWPEVRRYIEVGCPWTFERKVAGTLIWE